MSEQEAIAYIKTWDLTEAAKVLRWYEEEKLLRPCDCDTIVAIETENLSDENAKLRELLKNALTYIEYEGCGVECPETGNSATLTSCDACNRYETESCAYVIAQSARELGVEVER